MKFKPVAEIGEMLGGIAEGMNIEIVEVECNEKTAALTVYIETEGGVDLDTCEKFHNAIFEPIDELDPSYGEPYTLNVSSPGLDRPFKTARDFERNRNKEVEVKLYAPLKGKKFLEGVLEFQALLEEVNSDRVEEIVLTKENQKFVNVALSARDLELSDGILYQYLASGGKSGVET